MSDRVLSPGADLAGGRRTGVEPNGRGRESGSTVEVVHAAVPGRVRLAVPGIKREPEQAQRLESVAATWAGINRSSANPATGNLLLEFDPHRISVDELVARVQGAVGPMAGRPRTPPGKRVRGTGDRSGSGRARPGPSNRTSISVPGGIITAVESAPVPPPPRPRTRAAEAALGGVALVGAGALLLSVRTHGHNLAIDQAPLALAQEVHHPALTAFMRGASRLAEPDVVWPVTLGAVLLGVGRQQPGDLPWLAPVAVGGGVTLISVLKVLLRRARPAAFAHLAPARGYSLPSGHAFLAATLYGLLAHHGVRWLRARQPDDRRAAAVLLAISAAAIFLVGISRVYLGVHYPTDVIAGYALALLWLLFLAAINDRPRPLVMP